MFYPVTAIYSFLEPTCHSLTALTGEGISVESCVASSSTSRAYQSPAAVHTASDMVEGSCLGEQSQSVQAWAQHAIYKSSCQQGLARRTDVRRHSDSHSLFDMRKNHAQTTLDAVPRGESGGRSCSVSTAAALDGVSQSDSRWTLLCAPASHAMSDRLSTAPSRGLPHWPHGVTPPWA